MKNQNDKNLRLQTITVLMLGLAGIFSACNSPTRQPSTGSELPTPSPGSELPVSGVPTIEPTLASLQLAVHPPEVRTGRQDLDEIIDVVLAHDVKGLRSLTAWTVVGCTHTDGLGGPPKCEDGETEGTEVAVVPFFGPEGHHLRPVEFETWPGPDALGLLAVYRVSEQAYSDEAYPAGEYAIVFLEAGGATVVTLRVQEGRVVRFDYAFGGSIEVDLSRDSEEMILPLSFNPIPTAVPWNHFEDPQGRFAFVYPPTWTLMNSQGEQFWRIGDQVEVFIRPPGASYVACFDQALGDCPAVEEDQMVVINEIAARRVKGWFGAIGGNTPQEFLTYIFDLGDDQLVMTVYALPFDTILQDISTVWPLEGMALELFERTVGTVRILQ